MDKDIERAPEVPQGSRTGACTFARARLGAWILVNLLATTSIIYVNKSIFGNVFGKCPSSFVAFHFAITGATLLLLSRPALGVFQSVRIDTLVMLPLVVVMGANVLLMNLALAWSSIVFYQIVRVLLSPITAAINFFLYRSRIPLAAFFALLVACAGVGVVSHFDKKGSTAVSGKQTSTMGAIFAVIGVCCSAIYTVWVSQYHKKLSLSSPQLLLNMVPLGTLLLAMASFFTDEFPVWRDVTARQWGPVVLSGFLACLVNTSQFFIVDSAGPVSSTVVGHLKTCLIVGLGWATSSRTISEGSILGVLLAIGGIIMYSWVMLKA